LQRFSAAAEYKAAFSKMRKQRHKKARERHLCMLLEWEHDAV